MSSNISTDLYVNHFGKSVLILQHVQNKYNEKYITRLRIQVFITAYLDETPCEHLFAYFLGLSRFSSRSIRFESRGPSEKARPRQKKMETNLSVFPGAKFHVEWFAPCRGISEVYYSLFKLALKRHFTSITHFQITGIGIKIQKIKFESKFSSQVPLIT